jgi:site-specific DNA-methyltransferase (adenine-specific)
MVLFCQEPFTTQLINESIPNIPFSYRMIWEKDHYANALIAKKAPVNYYEDILVFSKNNEFEGLHPLRPYFKQVFEFIGGTKKRIIETIGQRVDHVFRFNSSQFGLCTLETYNDIIKHFKIDEMKGFEVFDYLQKIDNEFKVKFASTFNLWEGNKYKSNILKYKKDYDGHHPTQKPVLLLEDLIKTFSNENDLVVDLTMGSGSTGVACKNTNRDFIGIEMNDEYFKIAEQRINDTKYRLF